VLYKFIHVLLLQNLCGRGANVLQTKSLVVEEAATELIEMLLELEEHDEVTVEEEKKDGEQNYSNVPPFRPLIIKPVP